MRLGNAWKGWATAGALFLVLMAGRAGSAQNDPEAPPRHSTQRLYMRDGSFQNVTEYHMQGDHVHYYSAERAQFEDVPTELVDLAATQKWNAERDKAVDAQRAARAKQRAAVDADIRRQLDTAQPEVAPRLRLPEKGYLWGLDEFQGKPELLPIVQPAAESAAREKARSESAGQDRKARKNASQQAENEAKARAYVANAALQPPLGPDGKRQGSGEEFHLEGTAARRQFHVTAPEFYLRAGTFPDTRFVLERMEPDFKHQDRRMAPPSVEAVGGASGKGFAALKVEAMPGGKWQKITLPAELPIGEYAIVRILSEGKWDAHVWDFDVDPRAFENGEAVTAATEQ